MNVYTLAHGSASHRTILDGTPAPATSIFSDEEDGRGTHRRSHSGTGRKPTPQFCVVPLWAASPAASIPNYVVRTFRGLYARVSDILVSPYTTAEPIEMPFGRQDRLSSAKAQSMPLFCIVSFRLHCTHSIVAACCYRRSSVVCVCPSVCWSVGRTREPCKNG